MPISFLLIPYGIGLFFWLIFSLLIMGHLVKYGNNRATKVTLLFTYASGAGCILLITLFFAASIAWDDILFSFPLL